MIEDGKRRIVIESVRPEINAGRFPIKRAVGEEVRVTADIFSDGHDVVSARLLFRGPGDSSWNRRVMRFMVNDRWAGEFSVQAMGPYLYTVEGWVDHFRTWQNDLLKKYDAGQDISVDLQIGQEYILKAAARASASDRKKLEALLPLLRDTARVAQAVEAVLSEESTRLMDTYPDTSAVSRYERELAVVVDRTRAVFSSWYERFPRSCSPEEGRHGTFRDCEAILPEIAKMGFDVFYLPPIHPIGRTKRKGKNNAPSAEEGDVGSPWAIGAEEGGHKSVHTELGTMEDFERLVRSAETLGIEVALDIALQCSPDHPYVKEHPEWFKWRPDGTVQFAENPPKKYEDIIPINFECEVWQELWDELKSIFLFWISKGVRIFRVDNPHTKPFSFWEWVIMEIRKDHPDVIFLSEAFTRPKVMYRLAKLGFTQSYTYFTWRNTKREFTEYMRELVRTDVREFMRPNFWTNTPDILPEHLQYGGRPAYLMRLVLAATLSSNYGIYGPAFELYVQDAIEGKEEYLYSEKYEVKLWDWDRRGNLKDFVARINRIRRENPALQDTWNVTFYDVDNDYLMCYGKTDSDLSNIIIVAVNLDPYHTQSGWVTIPIRELGVDPGQPYLVHDLLSDSKFIWHGERNFIELNPHVVPAHIFRVRKRLKREMDFDYFM
ncbi:MAG: alpha-1,4-glucan--maltose-1-phosphate maltosyltransferase [Nitrospiraceae bacterium]|nr:MAG: alpha-1,4-glucan--maltose-1-phosphate maltosyltransferase [Nitrospiraceae bacterium]